MIKDGFKQCSKCQEIKPVDDFYSVSKSNDKKRTNCKYCMALQSADYKEAHPKIGKTYQDRYCKAHPERRKESISNYYTAHILKIKEQLAVYRKTHAEELRKRGAEYVANLSDGYIKKRIKDIHHVDNPSPEFIELKRNQLLYKRALKELQKTIKGGKENGSD